MTDTRKDIAEILLILSEAKCELIDQRRCFVLPADKFYRVLDMLNGWPGDLDGDARLAAMGWNNFVVVLSAADRSRYFVVSEAKAVLDEYWTKKGPKEKGA